MCGTLHAALRPAVQCSATQPSACAHPHAHPHPHAHAYAVIVQCTAHALQDAGAPLDAHEAALAARAGKPLPGLPEFRVADVTAHGVRKNAAGAPTLTPAHADGRVWVTYMAGVYDITDFVAVHPGAEKILMGAGSAVDPFWRIYAQHQHAHVHSILEKYRIGNLSPEDVKAAAERTAAAGVKDAYANDPERNPLLRVHAAKPFNAETPGFMLADNYITPVDALFVRNHLPVPDIDPATYRLEIVGDSIPGGRASFTLDELRTRFTPVSIVSVLQCAGNRRSQMNKAKETRGLAWDVGAMGNVKWTGVRLCDVLASLGVPPSSAGTTFRHVQFEGLDEDSMAKTNYAASIPADWAMDERRDILLAYEMNDKPLTRDHGFPVRSVVPGVTGARQVKWLGRIALSTEEVCVCACVRTAWSQQ